LVYKKLASVLFNLSQPFAKPLCPVVFAGDNKLAATIYVAPFSADYGPSGSAFLHGGKTVPKIIYIVARGQLRLTVYINQQKLAVF